MTRSRHTPRHRQIVLYRSRSFVITLLAFAACAALAVAAGTTAAPAVTAASEQQLSVAASSHTPAARVAVRSGPLPASVPASTAGGGYIATPVAPVQTPTPSSSPSVVTPGLLVGTSLNMSNAGGSFDSALAAQDAKYGRLGVMRVFYPGFPAPFAKHPQLMSRASVISFKVPAKDVLSGAYDARFKAWFASAPKTADVFWSYWHEPENDSLNLADYRAAWAHLARLAHATGNSHLHATLILMEWSLHAGSHRDWHNYYAGSQYIDVLGWDVYNTGVRNTGTYKGTDKLFSLIVQAAKSVNKPWGVAELGSLMAAGDNGTAEAAWLKTCTDFMLANGAAFATYFDEDRPGGDFRLRTASAIQSWRWAVSKSKR